MSKHVYDVLARVEKAAQRSGRSPDDITVVAVSKMQPVSMMIAAYNAGMRHFGENRGAELEQKVAELADYPDIVWHFIGRLQTRQSLPVVHHRAIFHAVDRIKIATRLSAQLMPLQRTLPVFIQVNVSGERTKAGFECSNWEHDSRQREGLIAALETITQLPYLDVRGFMTMAPWGASDKTLHTIFGRVRALSAWAQTALPAAVGTDLSMGMSSDFEIAIEEGATHVRVGSALFGAGRYV